MTESDILKYVQLALSKLRVTIFRSNTGLGWVGRTISHNAREITLADPRALHAGLTKGSSDLIGWQSVTVTPEMVGKRIAIFTAIEVKGPAGRLTADQKNFLNVVTNAGGCAFMARGDQDAVNQLTIWRDITGITAESQP